MNKFLITILPVLLFGCNSTLSLVGKWECNCVDIINNKPFKLVYNFIDDSNGKLIELYNNEEMEFTYRVALFEGEEDEGAIFMTMIRRYGKVTLKDTDVVVFRQEGKYLITPGIQPIFEKIE